MRISEIELPSNRKFGLFFAGVFALATAYFFYHSTPPLTSVSAWVCAALALGFLTLALTIPDILLPLNRLWMQLGAVLGMIFSPIVLAILFFGVFTPIALLMRLFGRDELRLIMHAPATHWKERTSQDMSAPAFKRQF